MLDRLFRLFRLKSRLHADGLSVVKLKIGEVALEIEPEDGHIQASRELARQVMDSAAALESKAKSIASTELLTTYNTNWRSYSEVQGEGSFSDVENPEMSAADFEQTLKLSTISVTGGQNVDFYFEDGGLFWGHTVVVMSFDGVAMNETSVSLMG